MSSMVVTAKSNRTSPALVFGGFLPGDAHNVIGPGFAWAAFPPLRTAGVDLATLPTADLGDLRRGAHLGLLIAWLARPRRAA